VYLRFTSPWEASVYLRGGKDVHRGIFGPAYDIKYGRTHEVATYLRDAVTHELKWFEDQLPVPRGGRFYVKSKKRWRAVGICWFRDDAREMIARAFGLRALLAECDVLISDLHTDRPGQVLYRDDYQIIAKPERETPTMWS